nr:uncharacterized protein LOC117691602 isoform X1 [Crassostrea gigas]
MGTVHEELLRKVETKERNMTDSRMSVPRRVFLFNVDTFKDSQQVEGFENPKAPVPDPGISVSRSTPEVDGSLQGHVKPAAAKCLCEVKRSKGQGVFRRLKKYFGF